MIQRDNIDVTNSLLDAESRCALFGFLRYRVGIARARRDTIFRRGTIGHALMEEVFCGRMAPADVLDFHARRKVVNALHDENGWEALAETYADAEHAAYGASLALRKFPEEHTEVAEDDDGPLVERRLIVPIGTIIDALNIRGENADAIARHCVTASGKLDLGVQTADGIDIQDWKFTRTKPREHDDYDYPATVVQSVPDPQFAWYTLIMMALGYEVAMAVKVVIHAEKPAPLLTPSEIKINTSGKAKGLPSRQVRNVTAADYLTAMGRPLETLPDHNGLREEYTKHLAMLAQQDADRDANELAKVQVHAAWMQPSKVLEVCRERLERFAFHLRFGLHDRTLRVYPRSPCVKRFGCDVQELCHQSMGPLSLDSLYAEALESKRYVNLYEEEKKT